MLAVVIAGVAFWGYGAIRREATDAAKKSAERVVESYLDGEAIHDKLKQIIDIRIKKEADDVWTDLSLSYATQESPVQQPVGDGSVGDEYPGEEVVDDDKK